MESLQSILELRYAASKKAARKTENLQKISQFNQKKHKKLLLLFFNLWLEETYHPWSKHVFKIVRAVKRHRPNPDRFSPSSDEEIRQEVSSNYIRSLRIDQAKTEQKFHDLIVKLTFWLNTQCPKFDANQNISHFVDQIDLPEHLATSITIEQLFAMFSCFSKREFIFWVNVLNCSQQFKVPRWVPLSSKEICDLAFTKILEEVEKIKKFANRHQCPHCDRLVNFEEMSLLNNDYYVCQNCIPNPQEECFECRSSIDLRIHPVIGVKICRNCAINYGMPRYDQSDLISCVTCGIEDMVYNMWSQPGSSVMFCMPCSRQYRSPLSSRSNSPVLDEEPEIDNPVLPPNSLEPEEDIDD